MCDGNEVGFDAVVVGSGYGGSVAACRLSMAGINVCLIEKGHKWEAQDFPTDSLKIMSTVRMDNKNLGISYGPKDALFQVHEQDDSLAVVACGLGGGSLVNAGVMASTPVRARRNPKWPKEWEKNWDVCEASASSMLSSQSIPVEFSNAKVMREIAEEEIEEGCSSSMKLSMNIDSEEASPFPMGSCLACGNCLSGCPYNAKNSTDKNYLASAIQAGCTVKTECEVQYVVKSPEENLEGGQNSTRLNRRWRVYFNDIDYVASDFVVMSAGVFGTAKILFQSERRGLRLSGQLGYGFSCNGNTVAYLDGSSAPLNAYGLDIKQLSKTPFKDRPGPSISTSYTSSLGYTIQSAIIPTAYPSLLFNGITTYGWPIGFGFIHGLINKLKLMMGLKASQAMVLNAMGYDKSDGRITLDNNTNKICFKPPGDPLLLRKIEAFQKLTKRLGGILFMSRYRSTSVHLLGGCNVASDSSHGVCNPNGQVFDPQKPQTVHPGLYVCDASIIPCSIGINPCLTIATAAEHLSKNLVQDVLKYKNSTQRAKVPVMTFQSLANNRCTEFVDQDPVPCSMVVIRETLRGYLGGMPCTAYLTMRMLDSRYTKGLNQQNRDMGDPHQLLRGRVGGYIEFKALEKDRLYIIDGEVDMCRVNSRTPFTQYMHYRLSLASPCGSRYILEGKKTMNPYIFALYSWRESTTLHVTLKTEHRNSIAEEMVDLKGELTLSIVNLMRSLISMEGNTKGRFLFLLLQSFVRTYILQTPRGSYFGLSPSDLQHKPYPQSNLHDIKTDDGCVISCRQWKSNLNQWNRDGEEEQDPVLLINGYSTESFCLPTEPQDLVRTLLQKGHETWLLQARLHPSHPSDGFTIEDIGKFDIPAVIKKICELRGPAVKVHVVAHCVGGLAIHIALMGGHISATHLASLCCINSSMFFKLTTSSLLKMKLPLVPISMGILGKNTVLPMFGSSISTLRQGLLKAIARLIPRYERCTLEECEVFSGIFGNTFWHNNVSSTMHYWLNKQSLPRLPMSAFPHLRKICTAGFIVDSNGNNSYLIHPERMTLPTTYISGGRSLLVTPRTSFLANQFMKLHQPGYRHNRIVVEGFGHSDLLIGEESWKKVFPHILSHIESSEQDRRRCFNVKEIKYSQEALSWSHDPYEDGNDKSASWISPSILFRVFILLISIFLFHSCIIKSLDKFRL